jgi:hypothetical protein
MTLADRATAEAARRDGRSTRVVWRPELWTRAAGEAPERPPSGRSTRQGVRCTSHGARPWTARCSPGVVVLFRVLRARPGVSASTGSPPMDFVGPPSQSLRKASGCSSRRPSGVSLGLAADAPPLDRASTLLRFPTSSSISQVRGHHHPWLMISPRAPSRVTALRKPSSGWL